MKDKSKRGTGSTVFFVISPYRPNPEGVLEPFIPSKGPCGIDSSESCHLCVDHWRERKTGPCFPILVMRCLTHKRAFTVYPPGHVPYGRVVMAPVAPDGNRLDGAEPKVDSENAFEGTYFQAAIDAKSGKAWPRQCPGGSTFWWSTQGRHLDVAIHWLGLSPTLDPEIRQQRSQRLGCEFVLMNEACESIRCKPGYRSRGQAIVCVLKRLSSKTTASGASIMCGP